MNTKRLYSSLTLCIVLLLFGHTVCFGAPQKTQLPDYLGVFAVSNGKLIELQKHPQSLSAVIGGGIGGMDILKSLSGIQFPNGNVHFIVYSQSPTSGALLYKIGNIRKQITYSLTGAIDKVDDFDTGFWSIFKEFGALRISPVPENPTMMVRGLPKSDLPPGNYALRIADGFYDFSVAGKTNPDEWCADRVIKMLQVGYVSCADTDLELARVNNERAMQQQKEAEAFRERQELEARLPKGEAERVTALIDAAKNGDARMVNDLIKVGTNIAGDSRRGSPLGWACKNGHEDIVEVLISNGANVNDDSGGLSPLRLAKLSGNNSIVQLLIKAGARQ